MHATLSRRERDLLGLVLVELVFDGVHEGEPTGFDDVLADADGAPDILVVGGFDEDADAGGGAGFAVDDADFVVDQPHVAEAGEIAVEGLAHGGVEGVDGAVAFGDFEAFVAVDADFDGGFGDRLAVALGADADVVFEALEMRLEGASDAADEHVERGFGRFEVVALGLEIDDLLEDRVHEGFVVSELVLGGEGRDVGAAGELADDDAPLVADEGGIHVLVAAGGAGDGVDVHAAFVGEGTLPDEGLIVAVVEVGGLVYEPRKLGQMCQRAAAEDLVALFDAEIGHDGDQISVAAAFTDAVDRSLDLDGAGIDGGERIGDGQFAVVVGVDAYGNFEWLQNFCGGAGALGDCLGQ